MKTKIIIGCLVLLFILAIVINEINMRPKVNLVKDVEKIYKIVSNNNSEDIEIIINDGFDFNGKHYSFKGDGRIYLGEGITIALGRNGKCAMKFPYSDDVMFQEFDCIYE